MERPPLYLESFYTLHTKTYIDENIYFLGHHMFVYSRSFTSSCPPNALTIKVQARVLDRVLGMWNVQ